jgi:hypothetical protein
MLAARQRRALLGPLSSLSNWAQATTAVEGKTGEGAAMASLGSVGLGSASYCGGGHDRRGRYSILCSIGRRWFSQAMWWRARQVKAGLCPLIAWSAWVQPATVVADTSGEGVALAPVPSVGVGSASHCVGGRVR